MSAHSCPYVGCPAKLPRHILACKPHWFLVSRATRTAVNTTWRSGDLDAYLAVRQDAVDEMNEHNPAARPNLRAIPADEVCACVDADCPACGWPERITPINQPEFMRLFGCRKCDYVSRERSS